MIIITAYLAIGGVIFNYFEGWSIPESIYFCFITLSTIGMIKLIEFYFFNFKQIGFGDFVPGQTVGKF
jgi:hypothetical protein